MNYLYQQLIENAVPFYQEHGTLDLVALAEATSLGFDADSFAADVADSAAIIEE